MIMERHLTIPNADGLYWYCIPGKKPEPVLIDSDRYGEGKFRGFNGRVQNWLKDGESLLGPQPEPEN
jgi:hypothetical protein